MSPSESGPSLAAALKRVHDASFAELHEYFESTCAVRNRLAEYHRAFLNDHAHKDIGDLFRLLKTELPGIKSDLRENPKTFITSSRGTDYWVRDALHSDSPLQGALGEREWFNHLQSDPSIQERVNTMFECIRNQKSQYFVSNSPLELNLESSEEAKKGKEIIRRQARLRAIELRIWECLPESVAQNDRPYVAATLVTIVFYRQQRLAKRIPLAQIDFMISLLLLIDSDLNIFDLVLESYNWFYKTESYYKARAQFDQSGSESATLSASQQRQFLQFTTSPSHSNTCEIPRSNSEQRDYDVGANGRMEFLLARGLTQIAPQQIPQSDHAYGDAVIPDPLDDPPGPLPLPNGVGLQTQSSSSHQAAMSTVDGSTNIWDSGSVQRPINLVGNGNRAMRCTLGSITQPTALQSQSNQPSLCTYKPPTPNADLTLKDRINFPACSAPADLNQVHFQPSGIRGSGYNSGFMSQAAIEEMRPASNSNLAILPNQESIGSLEGFGYHSSQPFVNPNVIGHLEGFEYRSSQTFVDLNVIGHLEGFEYHSSQPLAHSLNFANDTEG